MKHHSLPVLRSSLSVIVALLTFSASAPILADPAAAGMRSGVLSGRSEAAPNGSVQRLAGHLPRAAMAHARVIGRVTPSEPISLALVLPLRDPNGLTELLRRLYTPGDALCGQFLTGDEFTERFGPTESDYAAVAEFAKQNGLTVTRTHPNRLLLDVSGPAHTVETAFGVRLQQYRSVQGRLFRAPDADPAVPMALAGRLSAVIGLDTATVRHSHLQRDLNTELSSRVGSGPLGGLSPSDVATAYSLTGIGATGAGQTIALFELAGYNPADIAAYETQFGLPAVPLQNILIDGAAGNTTGTGSDEVTLDIELAMALAPGLSKILVYEAPNTQNQDYIDCFNKIATDNVAKQISSSWGGAENQTDPSLLNAENSIFQQMAAQGQSMIAVTGDNGAYDDQATLSVDDPGAQPYVTGIGGTTLTTGSGGAYAGEVVWSDPTDTSLSPLGSGGGGGFSRTWPVPSYQSVLVPTPATRSVPDVALNSNPNTGYSIYYGGGWHVYGGTSAASPLWAGLTALVNEKRAAASLSPIGFLNPALYQIGASASYAADFHDIQSGSNLYYPARVGYDNATGWGSPLGSGLLNTLVNGLAPTQTGTVTGSVTAASTGAALAGVTVAAISVDGILEGAAATTDASGNYTLTVPAGIALTITVTAYTATGGQYAGAKAAVTVTAGQALTESFALQPAHLFAAGLQMISSPCSYSNLGDFAALFGLTPPLTPSTARLVAWNTFGNRYVFYPTAPADTLSPGVGYWVKFPAASYPHYDGALVPTNTAFGISLTQGWNLIGDPFPAAVLLSALRTADGATVASGTSVSPTLYRYNTATGAYVALNPASDALQPYAGYWIYAQRNTTLTVPAP